MCPNGVVDLLEHARTAEALGFGDFDAADHVLLNEDPENYPGGKSFRWDVESFWPDPLIALTAVGAVTTKMLLTTSIMVAPLRPAPVIAKMAATIDNLTNGRLRLGIGAGWNRAEFDACGVPYVGRTARMEDYVGACKALWRDAPASFHSETVSFDEVWCRPGPARPEGIPVLLGGPATEKVAERIARLADGWLPMATQHDAVSEGIALLRPAYEKAGRDPDTLTVRVAIPEPVVRKAWQDRQPGVLRDAVMGLAELGVTDVKLYISGVATSPEEVPDTLGWIADAIGLEAN